jgi:hypothetical protein
MKNGQTRRRELIVNTWAWMTPRIPECFLKGFHLKKIKKTPLDLNYLNRLFQANASIRPSQL